MTAVIFDCDGVLVDSEVLALEIELISLKEIGLEFDIEAYQKRHLGTTSTEFFREIAADYQAKFDAPLPNGFRETIGKRYREAFSTRLQIIDGVHDLLSSLDCPVAVASGSSPEGLAVKLAQVEIEAFFGEHVYSSHQVERGKPAPDLFLFAACALGISPADCIVVEDSAKGIRAAVAAGMRAVGFTGGGHCLNGHGTGLLEEGADLVIDHTGELKTHL
ncbi:MAG: HAD-IA family hydrolase [Pseudomonadota bacterium]|nr:HAD-IA family hydrolase [Pseudomonadota bacterium]